jgi:hypothetical protein
MACVALALAVSPIAESQDLQRGIRNYQDILYGRKKLNQLTPQEQQEVLIISRRVRAGRSSGKSSECRDARERAASAASDLATYSRRLQSCAESEDYSDDCSSEFGRVRSTHSDYEDAVSEVNSECN